MMMSAKNETEILRDLSKAGINIPNGLVQMLGAMGVQPYRFLQWVLSEHEAGALGGDASVKPDGSIKRYDGQRPSGLSRSLSAKEQKAQILKVAGVKDVAAFERWLAAGGK